MKINPNQSKYDYMLESSQGHMNDIALSTEDDRKITYEELFESIDKYEKLLYAKGVREGDFIGICTMNTPESIYLIYALNKMGAIDIGYSPFDKKKRVQGDVKLTQPKMVITTDMFYGNFRNLEKSLNFSPILYTPFESVQADNKAKLIYNALKIALGGLSFSQKKRLSYLLKQNYGDIEVPNRTRTAEELSDILFTGGSSGIHKGVDLNDIGLNWQIEGMKMLYDEHFFDGKTYLGQIPFGHMAFGRSILHAALTNDMTFALTLKAMPKDFYDELKRTGAHGASGGPPHWTSLIEMKDGKYVPRHDLEPGSLCNLQVAFSGGEAKKEATEKPINEALKYCGSQTELGDGLGATETWGSTILNTGNYFKEGKLGVAIPNLDVKLVDKKSKQEVGIGEKGLLHISGPSVMIGYHNNPKENAEVFSTDEEGKRWLNLKDYLVKEEDEFYKYVGRDKRNFVSRVDNIYPEEIEGLLQKLPEVRESVITPIPDDILQNIPHYYISLYSDKIDFNSLEKRIKKLISKYLGENALPGVIEYTTEPLKRMMNSKIDVEYYRKRTLESKGRVRTRK